MYRGVFQRLHDTTDRLQKQILKKPALVNQVRHLRHLPKCKITPLLYFRKQLFFKKMPLMLTCDRLFFNELIKRYFRDFPGGPVVKTPRSQSRGHRFDP